MDCGGKLRSDGSGRLATPYCLHAHVSPVIRSIPHEDVSVTVRRMDPATEARLRSASLTYGEVGGTRDELPTGYRSLRTTRTVVGSTFAGSAEALMSWRLHERSGILVTASSQRVEAGAVVILGLGVGRFRMSAPCRVVYVIDEPTRCGFAYGTLPGHPESGEESFIISIADGGEVELTIAAFSNPATVMAKIAGPIGRTLQHRATRRYLHALDG